MTDIPNVALRGATLPPNMTSNSRPAFPFEAGRQFGRASCAPPLLSAAVAQFGR
jgi:hypothetical protein